jgi:Ni/Fe-hydrogenase subunit HybB-like protein
VILGVILSSLHQSSLGSLFLIVPGKLYPLWYSSNLPYLFFISAIAVGPAMVTVESYFSSRAFGREIEMPILSKLGKVSAVALAVYLVLKIEDIVNMNLYAYVFSLNFEAMMYWAEITLGVLVPIALLGMERVRTSRRGIFVASLFVVFGFIFNRLNLSLTALQHYTPSAYFPSWLEITVTLMIVAIGFAAFRLAAKHLPVFPKEHAPPRVVAEPIPYDVISFVDAPEAVKN